MNKQLLEIQEKLKAPKSQYSNFGKYHYRSTDDILEALKPLLVEYKAGLYITDEPVQIGERYYIKSTATFTSEDGSVETTGYAREPLVKKGMDDSQMTGAASSYARKYALNGLFLIDDTKDADSNEYQQQTKNAPVRKKPTLVPKPQATDKQLLAYSVRYGGQQVPLASVIKQAIAGDSKAKGYLKLLPKEGQIHEAYKQIYSRKLYEKA